MPNHNFEQPRGKIEYLEVDSPGLQNNLLGDPGNRTVAIYLPEGYHDSNEEFPLLVDIVGFTGSGFGHLGWKAFGESVPQRIDRLVREGKMGPTVVALPDCFTSLGGNQYVNSAAMGNWADFLTQDMIRAIEQRYRVKSSARHRGIFGKSSGGYGAMVHGMRHADVWGAIACHSGDMDFELCYRGDMPGVLRALEAYDGDIERFIEHLRGGKKVSGGDMHLLMMLAMAASYDPDPSSPYGIRLPVTTDTCQIIDEYWQNWLAQDPVHMIEIPAVQRNLESLSGLYVDCGGKDQYNLVYGARRLSRRFAELELTHRYEEFGDNHSGVDYRMDISLPYLYEKIS